MAEHNILIIATGEIISTRMAKYIIQLALGGCTEECIPCHFREVWQREIDPESVSAFLERDTEVTDLAVPNGETLLADGRTMVPNGIVSEIARLARIAEVEFIAIYLTMRYQALQCTFTDAMVEGVLMDMDELWTTDGDGNPILAAQRHEPSGHGIGSLPTTPVTPRNGGRPRTSHRTPPPIYSPFRPEGHPRRVLAPIALLERQRSPPAYVERDQPTPPEEFVHSLNDAIISADEFLANLDYVLEPLGAHAAPASARHGPWRTRPGPFDRPSRQTASRVGPPAITHPRYQEIASASQSPVPPPPPQLRPALVSPPRNQRPNQHRRRPPPIITPPNNIQLDSYGGPMRNVFRTEPLSLVRDPDIEQRQPRLSMPPSFSENEFNLNQGQQPRFYTHRSPFDDEFCVPPRQESTFYTRSPPFSDHFPSPSRTPSRGPSHFHSHSAIHTRSTEIGSEIILLSGRDTDEYPESSDSSSWALLESDMGMTEAERSLDHFANYRAWQ
jgi:hypothetical protein